MTEERTRETRVSRGWRRGGGPKSVANRAKGINPKWSDGQGGPRVNPNTRPCQRDSRWLPTETGDDAATLLSITSMDGDDPPPSSLSPSPPPARSRQIKYVLVSPPPSVERLTRDRVTISTSLILFRSFFRVLIRF